MAKKGKNVEIETDQVTVTWKGNSRVYSLEVHGENFMDLAKEFAEKHGGEIGVE